MRKNAHPVFFYLSGLLCALQSGGLVAQGIITYFFGKQYVKELLAFFAGEALLASAHLSSSLQKRTEKTEKNRNCLPAATLKLES